MTTGCAAVVTTTNAVSCTVVTVVVVVIVGVAVVVLSTGCVIGQTLESRGNTFTVLTHGHRDQA